MERAKVWFGNEMAGWHYRGTNGVCVVMAAGTAVTKEPGTDRFAARFSRAGFGVLAFDHRGLGESGGEPRQVVRLEEQLDDWRTAIAYAGSLPGVDRVAAWGFSLSGGYVVQLATEDLGLAAAIAQTPGVDGRATVRRAMRHQRPVAMLRLLGRAVRDAVGGSFGRPPLLVPLAGKPGTVAMLTTPDAQLGHEALDGDSHPEWVQAVAARVALGVGNYRPARRARQVRIPLLVLASEQDQSAPLEPAVRVAREAPGAELVCLPGGHYSPFLETHEQAVEAELDFLARHTVRTPHQAERR
jgi:alpha-beta hydrolase superfamily lysophospholipase